MNMGAITDIWKSERGLVAIVSLALVTTVFYLGNINSEQWEQLLKWIITGYTAGKTITGTADIVAKAKTPATTGATGGES